MLCEIYQQSILARKLAVLILVLMEDALRVEDKLYQDGTLDSVLILVLMEDALRVDLNLQETMEVEMS